MIRISQRQRDTFDEAARSSFDRRVAARLAVEFPRHVAAMDDAEAYVRAARERAAGHGIDDERGVDLYVNLMLLLGVDFDTDPQLPWAAALLAERGPLPASRAECLYARAQEHLAAVAGPDYQHLRAALERFAKLGFDDLPSAPFEADVAEQLRALWPEKHASLGDAGARALAARAARAAENHRLTDARAVVVCADLMFILGSGVERDPAYPWAAAALAGGAALDPVARAQGLFEAARAQAARWVG